VRRPTPPRHLALLDRVLQSVSGGRPEVAIEHCREAAKIASASDLDEIDAFASSCLCQVYLVAGKLREAIEAGERAVASFEARGNLWWAGRTLWHLSSTANYLGQWDVSLNYCRRGLEHGIALDDLRLKAAGWTRLGLAHIQHGEHVRGLECCSRALALAPLSRDAAWARVVQGYGKIKTGRLDAGIAELGEALAWFESSHMRWTHIIGAVWLIEGYLRRGDRITAAPLIDYVLETSRATGYLQYEGRACWLVGESLAADDPIAAEDYVETATRIFERLEAQNDLSRAIFTRAGLRQRAGDLTAARQLLCQAAEIFEALGTRGEPARVKLALAALDSGSPIRLLADRS
jgi:tetratricopeptide (TPR) repeat protein